MWGGIENLNLCFKLERFSFQQSYTVKSVFWFSHFVDGNFQSKFLIRSFF